MLSGINHIKLCGYHARKETIMVILPTKNTSNVTLVLQTNKFCNIVSEQIMLAFICTSQLPNYFHSNNMYNSIDTCDHEWVLLLTVINVRIFFMSFTRAKGFRNLNLNLSLNFTSIINKKFVKHYIKTKIHKFIILKF